MVHKLILFVLRVSNRKLFDEATRFVVSNRRPIDIGNLLHLPMGKISLLLVLEKVLYQMRWVKAQMDTIG